MNKLNGNATSHSLQNRYRKDIIPTIIPIPPCLKSTKWFWGIWLKSSSYRFHRKTKSGLSKVHDVTYQSNMIYHLWHIIYTQEHKIILTLSYCISKNFTWQVRLFKRTLWVPWVSFSLMPNSVCCFRAIFNFYNIFFYYLFCILKSARFLVSCS